MIVIDLGCAEWARERSVRKLIRRFKPEYLYGFDPALNPPTSYTYRGAKVILRGEAAWIYDGEIGFVLNGARSRTADTEEAEPTPCIDIQRFLTSEMPFWKPDGSVHEIVLKMDIEGGEHTVLSYLVGSGADEFLDRVLVEWHEPPEGVADVRELMVEHFGDKLEEWA